MSEAEQENQRLREDLAAANRQNASLAAELTEVCQSNVHLRERVDRLEMERNFYKATAEDLRQQFNAERMKNVMAKNEENGRVFT